MTTKKSKEALDKILGGMIDGDENPDIFQSGPGSKMHSMDEEGMDPELKNMIEGRRDLMRESCSITMDRQEWALVLLMQKFVKNAIGQYLELVKKHVIENEWQVPDNFPSFIDGIPSGEEGIGVSLGLLDPIGDVMQTFEEQIMEHLKAAEPPPEMMAKIREEAERRGMASAMDNIDWSKTGMPEA